MTNYTDEEKKALMKKLIDDGLLPDPRTYIMRMREISEVRIKKDKNKIYADGIEDTRDFFDHKVVVPADLGC